MTDIAREHMRTAPPIRPWRFLPAQANEPGSRRLYLYVQAAPVFERHGYKGATIKALAHACHLSPASLYHYFGSKREMATYPLTMAPLTWETTWVDPDVDPLRQLNALIGMSVAMFPVFALALRMHEQIEGHIDEGVRARGFRQGQAVFGRLIAAAAPDMTRASAEALARDVLASLSGTAFAGLDEDVVTAQRVRMVAVLRGGLVPAHVESTRFDEAMAAPLGLAPDAPPSRATSEQTAPSVRRVRT